MEGIPIPKSGLVLGPAGADQSVKDGTSFAQVMQLDLKDGMFEEILKASRHGGKALLISFGKTIVRCFINPVFVKNKKLRQLQSLHYGTKQRPLSATRSTSHAQLYNRSTEDTTDLDFVGRLTHKLAMQQAQEDIAGADEALAKLQNSLASAKQAKQSNQYVILLLSSMFPSDRPSSRHSLPSCCSPALLQASAKRSRNGCPPAVGFDATLIPTFLPSPFGHSSAAHS